MLAYRKSVGNLLIAICLCASSTVARADSWAPPTRKTVESADRSHRFTVTPRDLSSTLDYFEDAVKGKERPGQKPGRANETARGRAERKSTDGRWVTVWDKPIINDVAPVDVIIANTGRYVASFDNWHFMGHGENVVVVYGHDGALIRSLKLSDLVPDYYIKALPHSVSSIDWRGDPRFSNDEKLILRIVVPSSGGRLSAAPRFVEIQLDPDSGVISPLVAQQWATALAEGRRVAEMNDLEERKRREGFIAPLVGPSSDDESDWHSYLTEAFFRLDANWEDGYPAVKLLRSPTAPNYKPSAKWLREALLEKESPADVIMIASPGSPDNLRNELTSIVSRMGRGKLRSARIYVASPPLHRDSLLAALGPSGAKLIYLDPSVPIPQRPERLTELSAPAE